MKEKIGRALLSFFVIMLCCTLVARGADSITTAKVQTTTCKPGTLKHSFSGTGSLKTRERNFQFLPVNQKVANVLQKPGSQVETGAPLIQLDQDYLAEQIRDQKRAVEKMQLQIQQQRLNGQTAARLPATAQAELSLDSAREARNKARENLKAAQEAYQSFLDNPPKVFKPGEDAPPGPQEPSAGGDASQGDNSSPPLGPTTGEGESEGGASSLPLGPSAGEDTSQGDNSSPPQMPPAGGDVSEGGSSALPLMPPAGGDTSKEDDSTLPQKPSAGGDASLGGSSALPLGPFAGEDASHEDDSALPQKPSAGGDASLGGSSALPLRPSAGEDASIGGSSALPQEPSAGGDTSQGGCSALPLRLPTALSPYVIPRSVPRTATSIPGELTPDEIEEKKQELQQQVDLAQSQLDAAQEAYDQAKKSYRLAEEEEANAQSNEAVQAQSSRLSVRGMELDLEELQEDLAVLENLQNAGGLVTAKTTGILESVGVSEGALTTGTEPIILASRELEACGLIPAEEIGRLSAGDEVEVLFSGSAKPVILTVERLEADGQGSLFWYAPVDHPNSLAGTPFSYAFNQISNSTYEQVIPLSALYEGNGSVYVLVAEVRSGILGESYTAVRVDVNLLEKDMQNAAIQTSLGREAKIITQSNKYVKEGDRVRLND